VDSEELQKQLSDSNLEILNSISFIIFELENNTKNDLFMLAKLLDEQSLIKLIDYYDGSEIKIPTKKEYKQNMTLAIYFFLTEVKGFSFKKASEMIKEMSGLEIEESEQVIGRRLSKLKDKLKDKLIQVLDSLNG
jgi:hypothetical protein